MNQQAERGNGCQVSIWDQLLELMDARLSELNSESEDLRECRNAFLRIRFESAKAQRDVE